MIQAELKDKESGASMICWLDDSWDFKKYDRVELKGIPDVLWTIVEMYSTTMNATELRKPWRVGGIS